jgi:hypothetical protein
MFKKHILIIALIAVTVGLSGCVTPPTPPKTYTVITFNLLSQTITLPKGYILNEYYSSPATGIFGYLPYGAWIQVLNTSTIRDEVQIWVPQFLPTSKECFLEDIKIYGGGFQFLGISSTSSEIFWPFTSSDYAAYYPGWTPDEAWFEGHTGHVHGVFGATIVIGSLVSPTELIGTFEGYSITGVNIVGKQKNGYSYMVASINDHVTSVDPVAGTTQIEISGHGLLYVPQQ